MMRIVRVIGLIVLMAGIAFPSAHAAGSVTISGTSRNGDILTVAGTATYMDFVQSVGTDPSGDALPVPGGGDLAAAQIMLQAAQTGSLQLRWVVTDLPPPLSGSPGLVYGWTFCVETRGCFEANASRFHTTAGSTNTYQTLSRCGDAACTRANQARIHGNSNLRPTFDESTKTVSMTIRGNDVANGFSFTGLQITPLRVSPHGAAFVAPGDLSAGHILYDSGDWMEIGIAFTAPAKQVSIAVAEPGIDPDAVSYAVDTAPAASGAFSIGADVGKMTGNRTVYARACFGAGNCAYATRSVTL